MTPSRTQRNHYPLHLTTLTLHRLSPLYHGSTTPSLLSNASLASYAHRLRDILAGDVLRGVRVNLTPSSDDSLARVGALLGVQMRCLGDERGWEEEQRRLQEDETAAGEETEMEGEKCGLVLEVRFEKAAYVALLLKEEKHPGSAEGFGNGGFSHFPLLATRMPAPLRETVLEFLASTFDARASGLKLSQELMVESLERYLRELVTVDGGAMDAVQASKTFRTVVKDVLVTIHFADPDGTYALRTMDIQISRDDIGRFIAQGRKLSTDRPFTAALSHYVKGHLALDLLHGHVRISKIACAAFVLGAEGKMKLFPPLRAQEDASVEESTQEGATKMLLSGLVEYARGDRNAGGST